MMKKPKAIDRMNDPFYAGLMFHIEQLICLIDEEAQASGVMLTDSQVRSSLIKTTKLVQGGNLELPQETDRDQALYKLIMSLYHAPDDIVEEITAADGTIEERPLNIQDWIRALKTVIGSVKTRKSNIPGSRYYLDFVQSFVSQTREQS